MWKSARKQDKYKRLLTQHTSQSQDKVVFRYFVLFVFVKLLADNKKVIWILFVLLPFLLMLIMMNGTTTIVETALFEDEEQGAAISW